MKKIFLLTLMALTTMVTYAHKRISETAVAVSTDTIYYNADYIRVMDRSEAAYGRLLLTEGTGRNKRDVFRDFYMNGNVKMEGGYSFIDLENDRNTKVEGDITAFYPNGKEKYRGSFVNGQPDGYFTLLMRDGSIATAEFVNGKSRFNYFMVTNQQGQQTKRNIDDLKSFLKK